MQKKLTITLSEEVYEGLHQEIGAGKIGKFIESLVKPHVLRKNLAKAYAEMASEEKREGAAFEWCEGTLEDFSK